MRRQDVAELHRAEQSQPVPLERDVAAACRHSAELRERGHYREADEALGPFLTLRHVNADIMVAHALNATWRRDWAEALDRWEAVSERFPHVDAADLNKAVILRETGRLDEAELLFCDLKRRLPDNYDACFQWGLHPHYMQAWAVAVARWQEVRASWPNEPASYSWGAAAFRALDRLDEARALLALGQRRFPDNRAIRIETALLLGRCAEWSQALKQWDALRERHPGDADIELRRNEAYLLAGYARIDSGTDWSDGLSSESGRRDRSILRQPEQLLLAFESLGSDCELGLLQRRYKAEPLGLLRWGGPTIEHLIIGLREQFARLGDADTLWLEDKGAEYLMHDDVYKILMHTFISVDPAKEQKILQQLRRRLIFLRRLLLDQMAAAGRIFVFKDVLGADRSMLIELHQEMSRLGPATLLVVQTAGADRRAGDVEQIGDRLFLGAVSAFGNGPLNKDGSWNIRVWEWLNMLRIVYAAAC